jgi:hypothetical protein
LYEGFSETSEIGDQRLWRKLDASIAGLQALRQARLEGTKIDPVGILCNSGERQSTSEGVPTRATTAEPYAERHAAFWSEKASDPVIETLGFSGRIDRLDAPREFFEDFEIV